MFAAWVRFVRESKAEALASPARNGSPQLRGGVTSASQGPSSSSSPRRRRSHTRNTLNDSPTRSHDGTTSTPGSSGGRTDESAQGLEPAVNRHTRALYMLYSSGITSEEYFLLANLQARTDEAGYRLCCHALCVAENTAAVSVPEVGHDHPFWGWVYAVSH